MSVKELETEIARLNEADFAVLAQWMNEYKADAWDRKMEADINAGKLDHLAEKANDHFENGRCTPL